MGSLGDLFILSRSARAEMGWRRSRPSATRFWRQRVAEASTGSTPAGIVGRKWYQFDIWVATVNVAARLTFGGITTSVALTELDGLSVSPGTKNERSKRLHECSTRF